MKRGFCTESHVVVYCDTCGDIYTDAAGEAICFGSTNQAVSLLGADRSSGWVYDGDTILCDICVATQQCQRDGHRFTELECTVCGIFPTDEQEY
ncbi:hypothetical protein [Nocardia asteroides]|uniref:hypothetical protein n=1 Tax=Nocardia asteroides TaxID=1824 RepID=UPI001E307F73|nr:hypothetical protein [Nocardia asteroides]UGT53774.1 hypothetical protein LTT85_24295 [Nocardia asteroides]